jgi:hypothetical protein
MKKSIIIFNFIFTSIILLYDILGEHQYNAVLESDSLLA